MDSRVADGHFREDLFYRLNVVRLRLPSLEQRREDIALLVNHWLEQLGARGQPHYRYYPHALDVKETATWPDNVRPLFNFVEPTVDLTAHRPLAHTALRRSSDSQRPP